MRFQNQSYEMAMELVSTSRVDTLSTMVNSSRPKTRREGNVDEEEKEQGSIRDRKWKARFAPHSE